MPEMTPEDLARFRHAVQLRDRCVRAAVERMAYLDRPRDHVAARIAYDAIADIIRADCGTPKYVHRLLDAFLSQTPLNFGKADVPKDVQDRLGAAVQSGQLGTAPLPPDTAGGADGR